jgi:5-methyltetrahydrofolate--homocysteine methyltransferase
VRADYEAVRVNRAGRRDAERLLPLEQARRNPVAIDWTTYAPTRPQFEGVRVFDGWPLADLVERIDWTPFFQTWELAGHYPAILDDPVVGEAARSLWRDAQAMLDRIVRERLLTARAVVGFWPANAVGDDVRLYADAARREALGTVHFLRQQQAKGDGRPNYCLADFVAPVESGLPDHFGAFAVTAGVGLDAVVAEFEARHDDYSSILARRWPTGWPRRWPSGCTSACAPSCGATRPARRSTTRRWSASSTRGSAPRRGTRRAPTTPRRARSSPPRRHRVDRPAAHRELRHVPHRGGQRLLHRPPESRYFGIGKIGRDQVEDYAARREIPVEEAARWLAPNIA